MKNLILKWLGLSPWAIGEAVRISVREEILKQREENLEFIIMRLNSIYDIDGMSSKVDDMHWSIQDLERGYNDLEDMKDKLEDIEDNLEGTDLDKVQELDDRLTELLAGYKLEVKLTQENY
jgi:phage shock protein A|tara:strand:+ start:79 stop:441 length:363 start_codon:yes stop_codon:yes gene_type:complete